MRNKLQKARVNSEKSAGRLGYRGGKTRLYTLEAEPADHDLGSQGKVFRHGHWEGLKFVFDTCWDCHYLFLGVKYAKKCSEESTIC